MKKELGFSTKINRKDAAGVIEALTEGMKDGVLKVQRNHKTLELEVPEIVELEVTANSRGNAGKFVVEVSWPVERLESDGEEAEDVQVMEQVAQKAKESVIYAASQAGGFLKEAVERAKKAVQLGSEAAQDAAAKAGKAVKKAAKETRAKVEAALEKDKDVAPSKARPKAHSGAAGMKKTPEKKTAPKKAAETKTAAQKPAAQKPAPQKPAAKKTAPKKAGTDSALATVPKSGPPAKKANTTKALAKTPPAADQSKAPAADQSKNPQADKN